MMMFGDGEQKLLDAMAADLAKTAEEQKKTADKLEEKKADLDSRDAAITKAIVQLQTMSRAVEAKEAEVEKERQKLDDGNRLLAEKMAALERSMEVLSAEREAISRVVQSRALAVRKAFHWRLAFLGCTLFHWMVRRFLDGQEEEHATLIDERVRLQKERVCGNCVLE
jgi:DNA repair exonuclease SbcCD ATPase subunit